MNLSLSPSHLKRYRDIAHLLIRHGRSDLVTQARLDDVLQDEEAPTKGHPEQLAEDLEALGPTFIKLGQLLSTRPDLLPPPYLDALSRLQDRVEPFPFKEAETIVTRELEVRLSKAFETFEAEPLAAASLGQVHAAWLRDGRPVAVKVQRPGIRERVRKDLDVLEEIAHLIDEHTELGRRFAFQDLLGSFRESLVRELSYEREAQNLTVLRENLASYERILIPQPVGDYTTSRVLTMDFVRGTKISELSPLTRLEMEGEELARDLAQAYLDQVLVHGFVHADPHPGNVFITDDRRLALIDLGMVTHIPPEMQEKLLKLLLAVSRGQGEKAARLSITLGRPLKDFDEHAFTRAVTGLVARYQDLQVQDLQVGRIIMEIARISGANGLRPLPELALLGKTLLNLDEVAQVLEPSFNPNEEVRRYSATLMEKRMLRSLKPGNLFSTALEVNELVQKMPSRLNTFLDRLTDGQFEVHVKTMDETRLMANIQKVANRIALGLVLAALIIGAAMLMQVETAFTILGYPGLAMILFLIAVVCGFGLVISVFLDNRRLRRGDQ